MSPSSASIQSWVSDYPLHFGSPEEFRRLCELLQSFGFVQENMEGHFHRREQGPAQFEIRTEDVSMAPALAALVRLFLQGKSMPGEELREATCDELVEMLLSLGLLSLDQQTGSCLATVAMYATHGLYLVSDRWCGVDGQPFQPPSDVVYPAILGTTRGFLNMIPASRCESFLEVCAGTGIAALLAATTCAKHAWAFDIAGRSTHFAEFNRRLNQIENVTVAQGDLYEPAGALTFDRIVGHPPYVPVLEPKFVFYDGGEDGEQITRRMVQELPRHLKARGLFLCVSLGSDRVDQPMEHRVRGWLGEAHHQFDVALFVRSEMEPAVQALNDVVQGRGSVEQVQRWREVLKKLQIVNFVFGGIYILHHGENRAGFTIRRTLGKTAGVPEIESLLAWEGYVARNQDDALLRHSRLKATPDARFHACYSLKRREWVAREQHLEIDEPFKMELRNAPSSVLELVAQCDTPKTGEELFEHFKAKKILQPETPFRTFCDVLTVLVSGGFLRIEG